MATVNNNANVHILSIMVLLRTSITEAAPMVEEAPGDDNLAFTW